MAKLISLFMLKWLDNSILHPGFPVNHLHTENLFLSFMLCNMIVHIQLPRGFISDVEQHLKSLLFAKEGHAFKDLDCTMHF